MSLSGHIRDFGIPDIFQLIAQQQKTGILYLTHHELEGQVVFDKGKLVLARFTAGYEELLLGQILQRSGLANEQQVKIGMENQKKTLRSLGDILMAMQVITPAQLTAVLALQRQEVLFHIFQMKDGTYNFRNETFQYNPRLIQPVSTSHILMDGIRMLDEWPALQRRVGSFQRIFEVTAAGQRLLDKVRQGVRIGGNIEDEVAATFGNLGGGADAAAAEETVPLSESERDMLLLINGRRDLSSLISASLKGMFHTCQTVLSLLDKGLIAEVSIRTAVIEPEAPPAKPQTVWDTARLSLFYCTVLTLLAAGLIIALNRLWIAPLKNVAAGAGLAAPGGAQPQELTWPFYYGRLQAALELFYVNRGLYPLDLNQLVSEGLLDRADIAPLENLGLTYRSRGNSFELKFGG